MTRKTALYPMKCSVPDYTPGPWVYEPDNPDYSNAPYMVWTSRGPGYGTVAMTCSAGMMPFDARRQAADARLIATAPLMRAELLKLHAYLGDKCDWGVLDETPEYSLLVSVAAVLRQTVKGEDNL